MTRIKNKNKKRIIRHDQWIEIKRKNGQTIVEYYPPNLEFERLRLEMDPPPHLIYRRMNFVNGVPNEYLWTKPDENIRLYGGLFLQRILPEDWPAIMAAELTLGNTHIVPATNAQPRPPELGPCPCPACTAEREDPSGRSRYDRARK
jgi:hypothetical protein